MKRTWFCQLDPPFRPRHMLRMALGMASVWSVWASMVATTWAQGYQEEVEEKTYVPSYMIIIFAVGFALLMICRSGKRSTSFHREE